MILCLHFLNKDAESEAGKIQTLFSNRYSIQNASTGFQSLCWIELSLNASLIEPFNLKGFKVNFK